MLSEKALLNLSLKVQQGKLSIVKVREVLDYRDYVNFVSIVTIVAEMQNRRKNMQDAVRTYNPKAWLEEFDEWFKLREKLSEVIGKIEITSRISGLSFMAMQKAKTELKPNQSYYDPETGITMNLQDITDEYTGAQRKLQRLYLERDAIADQLQYNPSPTAGDIMDQIKKEKEMRAKQEQMQLEVDKAYATKDSTTLLMLLNIL